MIKLCPRCRLPLRNLSRAIAATSNDGRDAAVIGICLACVAAEARLPSSIHRRRMQAAIDRAMDNPTPYHCTTFTDIGTAELAVGMLGMPELAASALAALGWITSASND